MWRLSCTHSRCTSLAKELLCGEHACSGFKWAANSSPWHRARAAAAPLWHLIWTPWTTRSSLPTIPMSPCSASVGLKYTALVPVDTSVWHTFWAMKPRFAYACEQECAAAVQAFLSRAYSTILSCMVLSWSNSMRMSALLHHRAWAVPCLTESLDGTRTRAYQRRHLRTCRDGQKLSRVVCVAAESCQNLPRK